MKKTIVLCLFCTLFILIPASVCLAQGWENDDFYGYDDFSDDDSFLAQEPYDTGFDDSADVFVTEPAAPASDDSASAAAAAEAAAAAAEAAAARAEAAADSITAATANAPQSAYTTGQQPPVRIVIPMMPQHAVQVPPPVYRPAPPAPPPPPPHAYHTPPPAYHPPPPAPPPPAYHPPAPHAPPMYRQSPITVIPSMPSPYSVSLYRIQLGAFTSSGLAQQCFSRLLSAGLYPAYEPYSNVTRVVLPGIKAADLELVVQRLAAAGFSEVWIREER